MVTVRPLLTVAHSQHWVIHQMDVHNALFYGDLSEEVYMEIPSGLSKKYAGQFCRLKNSIYGLNQAPRCWFSKLSEALKHHGCC